MLVLQTNTWYANVLLGFGGLSVSEVFCAESFNV